LKSALLLLNTQIWGVTHYMLRNQIQVASKVYITFNLQQNI